MFFNREKQQLFESLRFEYTRLLNDNIRYEIENSKLKKEINSIAIEVIDRYCPPELLSSAYDWLKTRN